MDLSDEMKTYSKIFLINPFIQLKPNDALD